jgi:hypothetical protein
MTNQQIFILYHLLIKLKVILFSMATGMNARRPCCKCNKGGGALICDGCHQSFCLKHVTEHRQELAQQMEKIGKRHETLKRDFSEQNNVRMLFTKIDRWEKESIAKISSNARAIRADLKRLTDESTNRLTNFMEKLSNEIRLSQENDEYVEDDLDRWTKQLEEFRKDFERLSTIELFEDTSSVFRLLKIKNPEEKSTNKPDRISQIIDEPVLPDILLPDVHSTIERSNLYNQSAPYPCVAFGLSQSVNLSIDSLFEHLMYLHPMNKNEVMNSRRGSEIDQMERFLSQTFGFKTLPEKYIVQNIPAFQLDRLPYSMDVKTMIYFPNIYTNSFAMTAEEIVKWQHSYAVYADKNVKGMTKEFLYRALQGQSRDGEAAFRMKFVVRISTCPIMMESDMKIIGRKLDEDWPNRIKLVSASCINFAGRQRDIGDILYYISNWKEVFDIDSKTNLPLVYKERDFRRKVNGPQVKLYEDRIRGSLIRMAKLRLQACDEEGVQIVVETGLGLGISAGNGIGIDEKIRAFSAEALRTVLQQNGSSYKNIRAVIFALPMFNKTQLNQHIHNTFKDFVDEFHKSQYNGPIPVLIADQDVHRLTVAIARFGFIVSELCPANSYNIFGGNWQQREPHLEEKIALTTIGLLVQHHLNNPEILNPTKYHFIETSGRQLVDWLTIVLNNNGKIITNNGLHE